MVPEDAKNGRTEEPPRSSERSRFGSASFLDQAADAFLVFDDDARYVDVNRRACELLGYTREELLALRISDLIPAEDLAAVPLKLPELRAGKSLFFARRIRCKDGRLLHVELSARQIEVGRYLGIVRDVTARERAEEALRRSEASFRALIELLPDGVVVHRDGRILYVNPEGVARLGYDAATELVGRPVADIIHPDDRAEVAGRLARIAATGKPLEMREDRFLKRDGSIGLAEVVALQVMFDGAPAIVALSRDVTEQKQLQAQLAQADRLASMGLLAAGVAHEINNPLTYMMLNLERIVRELPDLGRVLVRLRGELTAELGEDAAARILERVGIEVATQQARILEDRAREAADGARRVAKIAGDLKVFARADSDERAPVSVNTLLDKVIDIAANELRFRATIRRRYGDVPRVMANAGRLSQVFLNLVVNAAHSIDEGAPGESTVQITTKHHGAEVWIEVADTGRGIPPEHLGRLFDPFFTTKAAGLGSGLGLSICANIVRAHGGRIEVASEPGRGSRFTVCLPESDTMDVIKPEPISPSLSPVPPARRPRILIVDDERPMRTTLAALLSDRYDVLTADSGAAAIGTLKNDPAFDAVLCDLMMPQVSGVDVYAWIQAEAPELAQKVVFMTGGAFTPRARELLDRVPNRHVEKPFELGELSAALERVTRPS
jgi:two-component system, NtrC family, sensor kinase